MTSIKNILFDLGGVLFHIDYNKTIQKFNSLGIKNFHEHYSQKEQNTLCDSLEVGKISFDNFIKSIKTIIPGRSEKEIINAWNAMLIGMPKENIDLLKNISKRYRLYLLSNTNIIHIDYINKYLFKNYQLKSLNPLFSKVYLSHEIGMRKPDVSTFEWVIKDANILARETLFIEDSIQHIENAQKVGIQTHLWKSNESLKNFFLDKALQVPR
tara:strand:- start:1396 stop:2031 length:636 start_codon:yes stop_codon:yes gene_type:complete